MSVDEIARDIARMASANVQASLRSGDDACYFIPLPTARRPHAQSPAPDFYRWQFLCCHQFYGRERAHEDRSCLRAWARVSVSAAGPQPKKTDVVYAKASSIVR